VLRLYGEVAKTALQRAAKSWLAALSIPIYALLFLGFVRVVGPIVRPLGMIGGMVIGIFGAACFAGYLSLLKASVAGDKIRLVDLKDGMRAVWDVTSVFFVLWIIDMVLWLVVKAAGPQGTAVMGVASLAMAIFFNLIPELICHSRNRGGALLQESAEFVLENPFSWFAPNLIFAAIILWATGTLSFTSPGENLVRLAMLGSEGGVLRLIEGAPLWQAPLLIAFVHYVMVFRGLLYLELSSGSSRMRAFRRRMG
jgi:hypothetical protein